MISRMGNLYDYFAAGSDEAAAATIDLPGGPGGALPSSPEMLAAIRSGDRAAMRRLIGPRARVSEHGLHVLSVKGVDPVVQLGTLEALLTGVSLDAVLDRPDSGRTVAIRDGGERLVLALADELRQALADATPERLDVVAGAWFETEEFWGQGDPETLAHFLRELSQLGRHARERNHHLYCWVCV